MPETQKTAQKLFLYKKYIFKVKTVFVTWMMSRHKKNSMYEN